MANWTWTRRKKIKREKESNKKGEPEWLTVLELNDRKGVTRKVSQNGWQFLNSTKGKGKTETEVTLHYRTYWKVYYTPLGFSTVQFEPFFCLDAAWLNEGRCPGGRPSVS